MKLDDQTARESFARARVARLATVDATGAPHLVPVTFAMAGNRIVTAVDAKPKSVRELKRLRNIRADSRVCLLADHYEEDWRELWWVRADGSARVLENAYDCAEPLRILAQKYVPYREEPPSGPVISVTVTRWQGWAAA